MTHIHYPGTTIVLEATDIHDADGNAVTPDVARFYVRREEAEESTTVTVQASEVGAGFVRTTWTIPDDALPGRWLYAVDLDGTTVDQYRAGSFTVEKRPVGPPPA